MCAGELQERTGDTGDNEFADVSSENFISAESDGVEEPGLEWPNIDQDSDADDNDDTVDGSADNPVEANNTDESEDVIEKPSVIAPKALGDVMESVVAAVFADVDMDLDRTWEVVWPIMKETIGMLSLSWPAHLSVELLYARNVLMTSFCL